MKNESIKGLLKLIISILIYYLIDNYFLYVLGLIGIKSSNSNILIFNTIKYIIIVLLVYLIYHGAINGSKNKFGKSKIMSIIFSLGSFVLLVFINSLLHKFLPSIGINVSGGEFISYFDNTFNLNSALSLFIDVILKPFLLVVIFPLGFSNVIKNISGASFLSGFVYAIVYGISLHTTFENAFLIVLIPSIIIVILTYLYKSSNNIWMVYISYALYIMFGIYIIGMFK